MNGNSGIKGTIDFAIIGAQKSATTSIQYYLNSHPEVNLPLGEQPFFESPDYERGRVSELQTIRKTVEKRFFGIKRPTLFSDIVAINRLKLHSPDCKLVMVCRDPIERFVSAYFHYMNSAKIPVMEINKAVESMFNGNYLAKYSSGIQLLRYGIYADALEHIVNAHGNGSLLLFSQEDIKCDFQAVADKICQYFDLEFMEQPISEEREKNKGSYDYRRARVLKFANMFKYQYSNDRTRKEYRSASFLRMMGGGVSRVSRYWPFSAPLQSKSVLTEQSKELLRKYYSEDRQRLLKGFPDVVYW